ncbi:ABC transporter ATP-binding protein [Pseudoalteromonas fenneropenaei]|uniref:ABC transporter ATP-binding protein n=1 Tax=Pseudoalteromonas fenneropenaei TaxID=1737459 RepID=A0ABV7CKS4_9GAMM
MDSKTIIKINQLNKVFRTEEVETYALRDISFAITEGEYVSISGASGCGKSTLLSILGLMDIPAGGEYHLAGNNVVDLNDDERAMIRNRHIGFIFQAFNLIGDLTVEENVELPLSYRDDLTREQRKKMAHEALSRVNMVHRARHYPSQLSGGQQQRVAIARAIAGNPTIILADEPTGNLDSENTDMVMSLLDKLHTEGATICMVTHDPRSAECAKRIIMLADGKIVSDKPIALQRSVA